MRDARGKAVIGLLPSPRDAGSDGALAGDLTGGPVAFANRGGTLPKMPENLAELKAAVDDIAVGFNQYKELKDRRIAELDKRTASVFRI